MPEPTGHVHAWRPAHEESPVTRFRGWTSTLLACSGCEQTGYLLCGPEEH